MQELNHVGPSLCVKFHKEFVYAAYGPYLQQYNYKTSELLNQCLIFKENKVHGFDISADGKNVIAYGARSVSILSLESINTSKSLVDREQLVEEWVITGTFSKLGDKVFLLTCYNRVIICDLKCNVIGIKSVPEEKSILYSGSIEVLSEDRVYVNAGTVIGGVIVWDLFCESILHTLQGHEGSIFYVTSSDDGKYIASCSDDRSIILWDMETGEQLSTGWGHTARIWNLKFYDNNTQLISVSEDCTCRTWAIETLNSDEINLVQKNIYEVHQIKNVWGLDVCNSEMIAVTAGNDGRIKLVDLLQATRYGNENELFSLGDISSSANVEFSKDELIKGFEWFSFGAVVHTSSGQLVTYNRQSFSWSPIALSENMESYSISGGIQSKNTVVFSNNKNDIILIRFNSKGQLIKLAKHTLEYLAKVTNTMIKDIDDDTFLITLESPNPKDPFVCLIIQNDTYDVNAEHRFSKPSNFVSASLELYGNYLLVGARYSSLGIFDLDDNHRTPVVIRKISAGDTTTSVKFIEKQLNIPIFSITNRDGFYDFISINFDIITNDNKNFYDIIHQNKVAKGFLEGAYFNDKNEYIVYGFKSTLFYIFNETNSYELASQVCGGSHRQWKLCDDGLNKILLYNKGSNIYFRRISQNFTPEVLRNGLHGREIRDISILKEKTYKNGYLFCTASEDTTVRLSHFNNLNGTITNYWLERQHVSGLQRCKFINDEFMVTCSAREELFLWHINNESLDRAYIAVRQSLPTSTENPDLRIMDFDVKFLESKKDFILTSVYSDSVIKVWYYNFASNSFILLMEGKYQTCCIFNVSLEILNNKLLLIITPTDGHVIVYNITNCIPFEVVPGNDYLRDNKLEIVLSLLPNHDVKFPVHQSSIKTICTFVDKTDNSVTLYTGGDDNGLAIVKLNVENSTDKIVGKVVCFEKKAAASTITSVNLFNNNTKLLTASVDQIVRIWDVCGDKLVQEQRKYTTTADTGVADIVRLDNGSDIALIGGVGLSIWKL
ncbi:hypothetical protein TPHA_0J02160 [Tetrapisispora phaffii CBS 4417]|uniref:Anaphase-promoting complex subunit 4 WD40 domain-containing protein n=1 Tax=Tetrapisispora phaffii (strain ATCC 24235 / CBS 4417 / NBRC 1672 / NRRL Y-8282 / UCD 70-5) TaxID=1071381 RepID=G8BYU4_TETPH|nr:hypothetical protein TPHA_0J02160 [Tetrapisispora phaffii CBS 4417]CCE65036.1 hypothetical protein TPHA_0J02160 [Tetrapisispora phaffii CBS 4417]